MGGFGLGLGLGRFWGDGERLEVAGEGLFSGDGFIVGFVALITMLDLQGMLGSVGLYYWFVCVCLCVSVLRFEVVGGRGL